MIYYLKIFVQNYAVEASADHLIESAVGTLRLCAPKYSPLMGI